MKLLDVNHPFFIPPWRRYAIVAFCTGWALFEWVTYSPFWAILTTGLAVYTFHALILTFDAKKAAQVDERKDR